MRNGYEDEANLRFRQQFAGMFGPNAVEREFRSAMAKLNAPSPIAKNLKALREEQADIRRASDALGKMIQSVRGDLEHLKAHGEREQVAHQSRHAANN